jgi:hypothetical protein
MRALVLFVLAALGLTFAQAGDAPAPRARRPHWNVRIEVLMVALPQDKLLKLLPDLRDPQKVESAVGELLAAVERKEATLMGYPIVQTRDGEKGTSETLDEKRYPADADPAAKPAPGQPPLVDAGQSEPSGADTRNLGVTLEAEAKTGPNGESIHVSLVAQRVAFQGWENIANPAALGAAYARGAQPQFFDSKIQSSVSIPNGGHLLLGVHVLPKPEGHLEVFVLHAAATAIK